MVELVRNGTVSVPVHLPERAGELLTSRKRCAGGKHVFPYAYAIGGVS